MITVHNLIFDILDYNYTDYLSRLNISYLHTYYSHADASYGYSHNFPTFFIIVVGSSQESHACTHNNVLF